MLKSTLVAVSLITTALHGAANAEDFYRGKTVRLIVPSAPGGGYDASGRSLALHMAKHIPGEPTIVVQNMPGAGGLSAANWLFNVAPKDGLTFGLIQRGVPFYPFFGDKNATFVPTEFNWLGSITAEVGAITVFHTSKARTMADTFVSEVVLGGSGPNDSETYVNLMNNTIGTKFRIVSGYKANTETLLAIERGEVEGLSGSWSSMKANRPGWVRDRTGPCAIADRQGQAAGPAGRAADHGLRQGRRRPGDVERGLGHGSGRPACRGAAGNPGGSPEYPAQGVLGHHARSGVHRRDGRCEPGGFAGKRGGYGADSCRRRQNAGHHALESSLPICRAAGSSGWATRPGDLRRRALAPPPTFSSGRAPGAYRWSGTTNSVSTVRSLSRPRSPSRPIAAT